MWSLKHSSNPLKGAAFKALHIHLGKSDGNRCYLTESSAVRHCELQLFVELLIVPVRNLLPKLSCGAYISDVNCALPNPIGKRNNRSWYCLSNLETVFLMLNTFINLYNYSLVCESCWIWDLSFVVLTMHYWMMMTTTTCHLNLLWWWPALRRRTLRPRGWRLHRLNTRVNRLS